MSITLAPMNSRVSVRPSDDPYKKYWWLILAGFGVTGVWLSLPLMEGSVGSTRVDTSGAASGMPSGEASLDGASNPNGAPGSTLDLAMDIAARPRKGDGSMTSSLYQAPEDPSLPVETVSVGAAATGGTLADALSKAAGAHSRGWGGQKAQKGFTQPKLAGASSTGLGGGGSAASFTAGNVASAFGSQNSQVGFSGTTGLRGGVSDMAAAKNAKGALTNAASASVKAANSRSGDTAVSGLSKVFDGRSERGGSGIGGDGGEAIGAGGIYGSLDASPDNLKMNDPNLDKREFTEPPPKIANTQDNRGAELRQQIAMMVVTTVVAGMLPGAAGSAISAMAPMIMQMSSSQNAKAREQK